MVICLEQVADLHVFQLMPLPLTVSCFSKIQIGFVCVCVCVCEMPPCDAAFSKLLGEILCQTVTSELLLWRQ